MESSKRPTSRARRRPVSADEIRRASFPQALRGYDRDAVHALLDRVADFIDQKVGAASNVNPAMKDELAKVGERTASILTAADEAARQLREDAEEYAARLRSEAEDEARKAKLNASQLKDELTAEAEQKAQTIMDNAVARRRQLNQAISSLVERRDEIASEAARLGEELLDAVDAMRERDEGRDDDEPGDDRSADPDATVADNSIEPESDEVEARGPATLLVDPDEEDEPISRPARQTAGDGNEDDEGEDETEEVDPEGETRIHRADG